MLPHFVIIGAQKAGSTLLLHCLRDHPAIYMPKGETRFFEDPDYQHGSLRQLEALFEGLPEERLLGIKRPDYLARAEVPQRIQRHLPDAQLIVILRNPIERAISAYYHLMHYGFIPVRAIEDGLRKIIDGEYRDAFPKSEEILEYGFYHRHLMRYLNHFDREQIHVILFDALTHDTLNVVRQVYAFLGVDHEYLPGVLQQPHGHIVNAGVYSAARLRWLRLHNPLLYTYNATRTKRTLKRPPRRVDKLISRFVQWIDRALLARIANNTKPVLSTGLRQRLAWLYADDNDQLEEWLGHDLSAWQAPARRELQIA